MGHKRLQHCSGLGGSRLLVLKAAPLRGKPRAAVGLEGGVLGIPLGTPRPPLVGRCCVRSRLRDKHARP